MEFKVNDLVRYIGDGTQYRLQGKDHNVLFNEVLRIDNIHTQIGGNQPFLYTVSQHKRNGRKTMRIQPWNTYRSNFRFEIFPDDLVPASEYKEMTQQDYDESFKRWAAE